MTPPLTELLRPHAEEIFAAELDALAAADTHTRPPSWRLSPWAVCTYLLGGDADGTPVTPKYIGPRRLVEVAVATLATDRALLLLGVPGTAKTWVSEHLAAAISGDSTLMVQGTSGTPEEAIRYGWNYALLVAEGPSERSLVPAPVLRGMREGKLVRFEEVTRCPLEVQDSLLSLLSDRVLAIPELAGDAGMVFAVEGFNIIATANTRDRGVNEMSAALKRRFNFETVFPIPDLETELALVDAEATTLLQRSGVQVAPRRDVLEVLVTTFRELRDGVTETGDPLDRMSAVMSTAEAVSVAHAVGLRGWFLRGEAGTPEDIVECLAGTAAKDDAEDLARLRRYFEQQVPRKKGRHWKALHDARHVLPG